jgi:hypothetical protein
MDTCTYLLDGVGGKDVEGLDETLGSGLQYGS